MKAAIRFLTIVCIASFWVQNVDAQQATQTTDYHQWWRDRPFGRPFRDPAAKKLPLISVKGNKFVDPNGNTWMSK